MTTSSEYLLPFTLSTTICCVTTLCAEIILCKSYTPNSKLPAKLASYVHYYAEQKQLAAVKIGAAKQSISII